MSRISRRRVTCRTGGGMFVSRVHSIVAKRSTTTRNDSEKKNQNRLFLTYIFFLQRIPVLTVDDLFAARGLGNPKATGVTTSAARTCARGVFARICRPATPLSCPPPLSPMLIYRPSQRIKRADYYNTISARIYYYYGT